MSEQGESGEIFRIPEIELKERPQIYEDLKTKIVDSLRGKGFILDVVDFDSETTKGTTTKVLDTPNGRYVFRRILGDTHAEITIQRGWRRSDNPNIALEEIGFKVGRPGISVDVPDIEYHRSLKKGGSRTLKNNLLALKKTEEFIASMKQNVAYTKK